jgi:two-component system cell cycle response regulator
MLLILIITNTYLGGVKTMKALIIDPSKTYRLLLKEFLYGHSIVPEEVNTGEEALARLSEGGIELVCITMHLPDMTGTELARSIKALSKGANVFIILLSSDNNPEKLAQLKTPDINAVCQKMAVDELKDLLKSVSKNEIILCQCVGRVLYIEDHLTLANMTTEILLEMGLIVEHQTSAEQGLEAFEENDYDLVLLDIVLQGEKDGISLIEDIRERTDEKQSVPILAISSLLQAHQRIHALKVGANDLIAKPVLQAELTVRVANLISARQLLQQVTKQKQDLEHLAMTDQLTSLNNRYYLQMFVSKTLSEVKRHSQPLSLIMIDLDKFKPINDTFGHEQGDEVLVHIANVLRSNSRLEDTAVRLGGDEFLLVLPHCPLEQAIDKANKLRSAVESIQCSQAELKVSASFGVASTEQGEYDFKRLLALADQAAYQAKALGGNSVCSEPQV